MSFLRFLFSHLYRADKRRLSLLLVLLYGGFGMIIGIFTAIVFFSPLAGLVAMFLTGSSILVYMMWISYKYPNPKRQLI